MRRGLAAVAAAAMVAIAACALPAWSAPPNKPVITAGTVSVAMSAGNTNPPLLSGHFQVDDQNAQLTAKDTMSWAGPDPDHHPKFDPQDVCPGTECKGDGNGGFDIAGFKMPPAAYNGPYHVDATATATSVWGTSDAKTAAAAFSVAIPPPNVTVVTAAVDKDRNVTVSWDRDANTPDLQADVIWRKGPGDKDFTAALVVVPPNNGARVNAPFDGKTLKGGDYLFQVEARRNGATGDGASFVPSDRTAKESQSNKVTVPPPPPGQTVPPTTSPKGGGSPPVVKGTPSGVNRNSSFSGSSSATTPTSEAVVPDPGFARGLPYAGANPNDQNNSEGDNSAVAVTPGRHSSSGRGYLSFVAGGAVLFLGALHLRILKKRLDEPPSTLTPVA